MHPNLRLDPYPHQESTPARRAHAGNRLWLTLAAALALVASVAIAPAALAQSSGEVVVTAEVGTSLAPLTITLCDTGANFGTNLSANGTISNSTDNILSIPGNASINEGAFYKWSPNCGAGETFIKVNATTTWTGTVCASENGGTGASSLSIADNDLRFSNTSFGPGNYGPINGTGSLSFQVCGTGSTAWTNHACSANCGTPGISTRSYFYYLQVDRAETNGTFAVTTTWSFGA